MNSTLSGEQFLSLETAIQEKIEGLNAELGSSTDLVRAYYQVISAGVTESVAAMELLIVSAKASKAAHSDQAELVKGLAAIWLGLTLAGKLIMWVMRLFMVILPMKENGILMANLKGTMKKR